MEENCKLIRVLARSVEKIPPVWLMRQAGRYLPEYQALRSQAGSFWNMALTPHYAARVTLQPIERFGLDAAILFSDILTVPEALGQQVRFGEKEGPCLRPIESVASLDTDPSHWARYFAPVYETVAQCRASLSRDKALLGFAGAPWTLASYMAAGKGGDQQIAAKLWAYRDPKGFGYLLDILAECVAFHLIAQLEAGADAVQLFDSWAGGLPLALFEDVVVAPTRKVVAAVRSKKPGAKIIGFPRAASLVGYRLYAQQTGVDGLSLDTQAPLDWAKDNLDCTLQGNLDPAVLIAGGRALDEAVDAILSAMAGTAFIFNLGHGVLPQTPIGHIEQMLQRIRK